VRYLIYADPHWCQNSSIVRGRGEYSQRLDNLIKSINWVEQTAIEKGCSSIICLGDFFDKESLNSVEISALKSIKWADMSHLYLCGNHEMGLNTLEYNSANIFSLCPNSLVIDTPKQFLINDNVEFYMLPYILENNRKSISEYFDFNNDRKKICFSHNDLMGIQMGAFLSTTGFELDGIHNHFDLFLNGHLHNGIEVEKGIINLGNLTGQNFSEDASTYKHKIIILDISNGNINIEYIENPYAFNFIKLDCTKASSAKIQTLFNSVKVNNCVLSVTGTDSNLNTIKEQINNCDWIVESRVLCNNMVKVAEDMQLELTQVDHLNEFQKYVVENIGNDEITLAELSEVIK